MAEVSWSEFEDKEVKAFLKNVHTKLNSIENGHKKYTGLLSAIVYRDISQHFEQQLGSNGPWAKWSKSYQDAIDGKIFFRKVRGKTIGFNPENFENPPKPPRKPGNILQDKGRLKNNFKESKVRNVAGGFLWFNDAKTKSGFPYAFAHDEGGPRLPKRDFMWLSDKALDDVSVQTLQFLISEGI